MSAKKLHSSKLLRIGGGVVVLILLAIVFIRKPFKGPVTMSFDQAYTVFVDSLTKQSLEYMEKIKGYKNLQEQMSLMVKGGTKDTNGKLNLEVSTETTNPSIKSTSNIKLDVALKATKENMDIKGNAQLTLNVVDGKIFVKLGELKLDTSSGASQLGMINALAKSLMNKWVILGESGQSISMKDAMDVYNIPALIAKHLKEKPLLTMKDQFTINGGSAYHVELNNENVKNFVESLLAEPLMKKIFAEEGMTEQEKKDLETKLANMALSGYLQVISEDEVVLVVTQLTSKESPDLLFTGSLSKSKGVLRAQSAVSVLIVNYEQGFSSCAFEVSMLTADPTASGFVLKKTPDFELRMNVSPNGELGYQYDGKFKTHYEVIDASEDSNVELEFGGKNSIQELATVSIETPKDYVNLEDMFGGMGGLDATGDENGGFDSKSYPDADGM